MTRMELSSGGLGSLIWKSDNDEISLATLFDSWLTLRLPCKTEAYCSHKSSHRVAEREHISSWSEVVVGQSRWFSSLVRYKPAKNDQSRESETCSADLTQNDPGTKASSAIPCRENLLNH